MTMQTHIRLTPAQARMWAGQQMSPGAPLYNMALSYRITGSLDVDRFRACFARLIAEADALRLVIVEAGDEVSQQVLPDMPFHLEVIESGSPQEARVLLQRRAQQHFDLTVRSFDTVLVKLGPEDWIWYFNQHHIFTDASSFAVMFRRMEELYVEDDQAALPQFIDHIEKELSHDPKPAAVEHFESRKCEPAKYLGKNAQSQFTASDRLEVPFSRNNRDALHALCKEKDWAALTPQMAQYNMLATVLFAFLYRISGQTTLAVGAPVHNRATPIARRTAGLLIDVLPMAIDLDDDETFRSLFEKVRAETGLFLRHSMGGVDGSALHRSFSAVFNFITAQFGSFAGMPTQSDWLHAGHCDAGHQLRLQVEDFNGSGDLKMFLDLNSAVFENPDATVEQFTKMLDAFLANPSQKIGAVTILPEQDRTRLAGFESGAMEEAVSDPVPDLIQAQCARTPDAIALSYRSVPISYAEMSRRVERLAGLLQAKGVGPGSRVAIALPRTPAAVISMIAVMRCGAAYVPIDPALPDDRVRFICSDADCTLTIALDATDERFVRISEGGEVDGSNAFKPVDVKEDDTAYVLYTSGSTGKPKGVVLPHRGLSHYIGWAQKTYCANGPLRFALFSPLTFDLTVTSLFVPLVTGGSLRIYREPDGGVDTALLDVVTENVVDVIKLTPSHMRLLSGRDLTSSDVRQLIVGGEDFPCSLAHELHDAFGGQVAMHNEYGPTEATVGCIVHTFDPDADRFGSVPIGRPISNMRAQILNAQGEAQVCGVEGELILSGAGIADGYHARPDLTAAAFVPSEHGLTYRTGDLARFREDGVIEYLGRIDHQIKVNGVRVEAGEVEAALTSHPDIEGACVVLNKRSQDAQQVQHCVRCGLPSNYPNVSFDADGVCGVCSDFMRYKDSAQDYFQDIPALHAILDTGLPSDGDHDCVVLFSGGKDSTYMIGRLVDMGLRVLAFTLDNGFLSKQALANIDRVVDALGVDHIYGHTPGMNEIFADSLDRFSNVCNGCFKAIYTLGMQVALDRKIPFLFTGLSRGQFFETRLTSEVFEHGAPKASEIDDIVLEARKSYHRAPDAVTRCMDTSAFETNEIFEKVRVVDFYRYCDVDLESLYAYLDERLPWVRPSDTGRSTNCLINDVGIHVHKLERGYHNYALPYSWDVRMGVKERAAAMDELDDDIDLEHVENILAQIGYQPKIVPDVRSELIAYVTGKSDLSEPDVKSYLGARLPGYMIPAQIVHLNQFPLSRNGKIDRSALPDPRAQSQGKSEVVGPRNEAERQMVAIWEDILGISPISVKDDFFAIGGDSISAIRINTRARKAGLQLRPNDVFDALTIERLAELEGRRQPHTEQDVDPGPTPLFPAQAWFLAGHKDMPPIESQMMRVKARDALTVDELRKGLLQIVRHHDGLRTCFAEDEGAWRADILADAVDPIVETAQHFDETLLERLHAGLNPATGAHVAAAIIGSGEASEIVLVIHHLVVDALSWPVILDDLSDVLQGKTLPPKTASVRQWASDLNASSISDVPAWKAYLGASTKALPFVTDSEAITTAEVKIGKADMDAARIALRARGASLQQGVLCALALALKAQGAGGSVRIALEDMGRTHPKDAMDAARSVGWFTAFVPTVLPLGSDVASDPLVMLRAIGKSEGAKPAFAAGAEVLYQRGALPEAAAEVVLNILDDVAPASGYLKPLAPLTLWRAPDAPLRHKLAINASLTENGMIVDWSGAADEHLISALAKHFETAFRQLFEALPKSSRRAPKRKATANTNLNKLAGLIGQKSGGA